MSKILIIDDSNEFNFLLSSLLKFHKIDVESTTSPIEGSEKAIKEEYSLIICDYMMEDMNGLEVSRKIRESGKNELPVILITSKNLDLDEINLAKELNLTYVRKPIKPNELFDKVLNLINE